LYLFGAYTSKKIEKRRLARRLKPVTPAKDPPIETPERDNSPRCPAIIIDTTCNKCSDTVTTTIGA
jgi:hypothetical protein